MIRLCRFLSAFGVELAYGREQGDMAMMGSDGHRNKYSLMMDLPLFRANRQDRQLLASQYCKEAALSVRQDLLRQLTGQLNAEIARYRGLSQRLDHYSNSLLPDVESQSQAALNAYQSDAQDFNSVIQSYRTLLTAMMSVPGAADVRGSSMFGPSYVYIQFEDGTDIYWARSRVLEYLNQVQGNLPAEARTVLIGYLVRRQIRDEQQNPVNRWVM